MNINRPSDRDSIGRAGGPPSAGETIIGDLTSTIDEELRVQIAFGRLGDDLTPPSERIRNVAELIADAVNDVFIVERRRPRQALRGGSSAGATGDIPER